MSRGFAQGPAARDPQGGARVDPTLVADATRRARVAWPGVEVSPERFGAHLARVLHDEPEVASAVAALHVEDLYLALACSLGDAQALTAFESIHVPALRASLGAAAIAASVVDETLQRMREELFVAADGRAPLILDYSGKGALRSWLRVVALRMARRSSGRQGPVEAREAPEAVAPDDLELEYLKRTYGESFGKAFRVALAKLSPDDRVLLKQRFRHGLGVEELGAMHGVHPSTVSRRVTDARERLVAGIRDEMMRALNVGRAEVSSILRLITSEVEITLSTTPELGPTSADGGR